MKNLILCLSLLILLTGCINTASKSGEISSNLPVESNNISESTVEIESNSVSVDSSLVSSTKTVGNSKEDWINVFNASLGHIAINNGWAFYQNIPDKQTGLFQLVGKELGAEEGNAINISTDHPLEICMEEDWIYYTTFDNPEIMEPDGVMAGDPAIYKIMKTRGRFVRLGNGAFMGAVPFRPIITER